MDPSGTLVKPLARVPSVAHALAADPGPSGPLRASPDRDDGRARRWTVASVGAAALLTLLVTRPAQPPERSAGDEGHMTRRLDAASDRPFAVIATDNPNIAIVWLFEEKER